MNKIALEAACPLDHAAEAAAQDAFDYVPPGLVSEIIAAYLAAWNRRSPSPAETEGDAAYWKGAYDRMAARNIRLCGAIRDVLRHKPDFADNAWDALEEASGTGGLSLEPAGPVTEAMVERALPTRRQMNEAFYIDVCQAEDRLREFIEAGRKLLDSLPPHWHGDAETGLRDLCDETSAVLNPHMHTAYQVEQATKRYGRAALSVTAEEAVGWPAGTPVHIEHDGFAGTVQGHYETREGKRGVVLQQHDTRVVHVYGEKWLRASPTAKGERS